MTQQLPVIDLSGLMSDDHIACTDSAKSAKRAGRIDFFYVANQAIARSPPPLSNRRSSSPTHAKEAGLASRKSAATALFRAAARGARTETRRGYERGVQHRSRLARRSRIGGRRPVPQPQRVAGICRISNASCSAISMIACARPADSPRVRVGPWAARRYFRGQARPVDGDAAPVALSRR